MADLPDIRLAVPQDAEAICEMLASLAKEMGDTSTFASTPKVIRKFGFGPNALFSVMIASDAGLSLFFPHFSSTRAKPGLYVQDLWVAPSARAQHLGTRLLAASAAHAAQTWGAQYISLSTHGHNDDARRFYSRLGFVADSDPVPMNLHGAEFTSLVEKLDEH